MRKEKPFLPQNFSSPHSIEIPVVQKGKRKLLIHCFFCPDSLIHECPNNKNGPSILKEKMEEQVQMKKLQQTQCFSILLVLQAQSFGECGNTPSEGNQLYLQLCVFDYMSNPCLMPGQCPNKKCLRKLISTEKLKKHLNQ